MKYRLVFDLSRIPYHLENLVFGSKSVELKVS
jgi:hypothetical protein